MQQTLHDVLTAVTPFMVPLAYAGVALAAVGMLAALLCVLFGPGDSIARLAGWLLTALGIFFLTAQAAAVVGGGASIVNLGTAVRPEFHAVPFWQLGAAMLVIGVVVALIGGRVEEE